MKAYYKTIKKRDTGMSFCFFFCIYRNKELPKMSGNLNDTKVGYSKKVYR